MIELNNQILNISDLEILASKFSNKLKIGDLVLLQGDLGVGKTTFARFLISNLYLKSKIAKPSLVKSPTYPILITYDLNSHQIFHYDLYRLANEKDLNELNIYEDIYKSITLIEWPELFLQNYNNKNYYLIKIEVYSETLRKLNINYYK